MKDLILNQTKGGLLYYILSFKLYNQKVNITGKKSKNLRSPFYNDSNASFSLYYNDNTKRWHFKDFGNSDYSGDVFTFAAHRYNLDVKVDFEKIMDMMYNELLKYKDDKLLQADILKSVPRTITENTNKEFQLFPIPFSQKALDYFAQYKIPIKILEQNNVKQIERYEFIDSYNIKKEYSKKGDELIFAFIGNGFSKIYHPNPKRFLYLGNKPKDYEFGLNGFDTDEIVILTAGEKDVLTLKSLGYNAFCLSNEIVDIPRYIAREIYYAGAHLAIMYDIDETGLKQSQKLSEKWKCLRIILPNELTDEGGKDISDWIKLGLPVQTIHELIEKTVTLKINKHNTTMQSTIPLAKEENTFYEEDIEMAEQNVNNVNNAIVTIKENTNLFPVEVFPLKIQEIVCSTNAHLNYPIDFIGAAILGAASAAIGKTHKIKIKEGWNETSLLYIALVGKAGTNKSHPLTFALKPIHDHDAILYVQFKKEKERFDAIMRMSAKERKEKNVQDDFSKPVLSKTLASDITPESIAKLLDQNRKGIALYVDELASWINNFNRYSKGSEKEFWLSNWNGKPITIDRATKDSIFIAESYAAVLGTIQPYVLEQIGREELSRNGFIDRILFAIPDSIKKEYLNITEIDPKIMQEWANIISKILELELHCDENGKAHPIILPFSSDSFITYNNWHKYNTDLCNKEENEILASVFSKLDMYVLRLALILEILNWACGESNKKEIHSDAMDGAIKLIEYFRKTAIKANNIITKYKPLDKLSSVNKQLYQSLPKHFTTSEGLKIAKEMNIREKTLKNFIAKKELFEKIKHGNYKKRF